MAIFQRNSLRFSSSPSLFSRLQSLLFEQQRSTHTATGEGGAPPLQEGSSFCPLREGSLDTSIWRKVDSRIFGIRRSAISSPTWTVLKILQARGFEAYLVGGCVRDLILGKTPKDFDVVTTATLKQIRKQFYRCVVIGRRFPICQVHIFGSKIEVSSFETVPISAQQRQTSLFPQMLNNCDKKDFVRWKDCMRRDFTVNSLFYDPFVNTIYDYIGGIRDAMASEVRTVIPAHLSFEEDCARILRGLRIVARLGLRFSEDTATAVQDLSWSILTLAKARLMMELNFMLAYGAAVPSICLLQKYKLLDVLLPIQAAYLADQSKKHPGESSTMLMKLFSHVDKLLAADHPSDCSLWLGLLAFHLALVNHPQNSLVIWTFASVLYLGTWDRGIKFVRERVRRHVQFIPEILELSGSKSDELLLEGTESDESLLEKTAQLASLIKSSVNALTNGEALQESLAKYQMTLPYSDLDQVIFVSEKAGRNAAKIFDVLERGIISYSKERDTLHVNYELLKGGDQDETRFVLGKIIFDTLNSELACQENQHASMHPLSAEPIGRHIQDVIGMKTTQRLLPAVPENSVGATEDQFICQQNQNAIAMKKGPENTGGTMKDELIYQQNQKAITVEKRQPPPLTCPEISEDASEQICEKNQNAIATKKREPPMKGELASRQKRNAAAGKKRHGRLSSLFE